MPQIIEVPGQGMVEFPDSMSDAEIVAAIKRTSMSPKPAAPRQPAQPPEAPLGDRVSQHALNLLAGGIRGAGSIGATLMWPIDKAQDIIANDRAPSMSDLVAGRKPLSRNEERRRDMDLALDQFGTERDSMVYKTGKIGAEIAGTLGVGGAVANAARFAAPTLAAAPRTAQLLSAIQSSGMRTGAPIAANFGARAADMGTRMIGAGIASGAGAGLANPNDAGTGAAIGMALPPVLSGLGKVGRGIGSAMRGGPVSPEVVALAQRAKDLGITIPADRIVNSKPLNASAAALNYIPFSGRAGTEAKMFTQLKTAISRTFGQNSDNLSTALDKADNHLGAEFDRVLQSNAVQLDNSLASDLAAASQRAVAELETSQAKIILNQIDEINGKAINGIIDGQAAYNIKKTLDRIGKRTTPEAYYATELKKDLMSALNRSLGPQEAAAFEATRRQYGNMMEIEKLIQNGADGDVSIARIANMRNLNNPDLKELADISAQFLKAREGMHGASQRGFAGMGAAYLGGVPTLAATVAGGRAANSALNSKWLTQMLVNPTPYVPPPGLLESMYRTAPLIGSRD